MTGNDPNPTVPRTPAEPVPLSDDTKPRLVSDGTGDTNHTADHVAGDPPSPLGTVARTPSDVARLEETALAVAAEGVPGYVILGELGRGGMGVVHKARHIKLNRVVALKMTLGGERVSRNDTFRFLAEAEAVAAIKHENVVQVFDYGEADGRPFMALEFCAGGTLTKLLPRDREHASAPREMAALVAKVARGVAAAHALGIVHRDLKPGNVFLDEAGVPKVADFGLAKRGAGADVTRAGVGMGTPAYMAPEQARDAKFVGPQADVWALGVILYESLTGTRPFTGTVQEIMAQAQNVEPVAPRKAVGSVPLDLELICLKCLSKLPHERYATAKELADDLDRFLRNEAISVRPRGLLEGLWRAVSHSRLDAEFSHWGNTLLLLAAITVLYHLVLHVLRETGQAYWLRPLTHGVGVGLVLVVIQLNRRRALTANQLTKQLVTILLANYAAYGVMDLLVWQIAGRPWPFDDVQMYPYFFVLNGLCFCILGSSHLGLLSGLGILCWSLALLLPFVLDYAYLVNALFWGIAFGSTGLYLRGLRHGTCSTTVTAP